MVMHVDTAFLQMREQFEVFHIEVFGTICGKITLPKNPQKINRLKTIGEIYLKWKHFKNEGCIIISLKSSFF